MLSKSTEVEIGRPRGWATLRAPIYFESFDSANFDGNIIAYLLAKVKGCFCVCLANMILDPLANLICVCLAKLIHWYMRNLRALAIMMCAAMIAGFIIAVVKKDATTIALSFVNAILFFVVALYFHKRLKAK